MGLLEGFWVSNDHCVTLPCVICLVRGISGFDLGLVYRLCLLSVFGIEMQCTLFSSCRILVSFCCFPSYHGVMIWLSCVEISPGFWPLPMRWITSVFTSTCVSA